MKNKAWTVTLTPEAGGARTETVSQDELLALVAEAMHGRSATAAKTTPRVGA